MSKKVTTKVNAPSVSPSDALAALSRRADSAKAASTKDAAKETVPGVDWYSVNENRIELTVYVGHHGPNRKGEGGKKNAKGEYIYKRTPEGLPFVSGVRVRQGSALFDAKGNRTDGREVFIPLWGRGALSEEADAALLEAAAGMVEAARKTAAS